MRIPVTPLVLIVTVFAAAFAVTGCSSLPRIDYSESKISGNTSYEKFALLPVAYETVDPMIVAIIGESDISISMTETIFERRGYTKTEYNEADFLVGLSVSKTPKSRRSFNSGGSSSGGGTRVTTVMREKSWRLSIDVFDNKSKERVWSGWADTLLISSFEKESKRFRVLQEILEEFPN